MWLLNVHTYELREFIMNWSGTDRPLYTILSHTWEKEEVLFKDMFDLEGARHKLGWRKIEYMCRQTITDGYDWTWIDTCCIDKSSSAELSEAINSMFLWYQGAEICHVYLSDARNDGVPGALVTDATRRHAAFRRCRWWERGWTLQELLAPELVRFWDGEWNTFGTLIELVDPVADRTSIDKDVLLQLKSYKDVPVAQRFAWAAHRETARIEDVAYSLLGILDVNMPILYGEGRGAFRRLQEEFLRSSADLSILIWSLPPYDLRFERGALAPGPEGFVCWAGQRSRGFHLAMAGQHVTPRPSVFTNVGLRLELPCVTFGEIPEVEAAEVFGSTRSAGDHDRSRWQLADMNARFAYGDEEHNVFLILTPLDESGGMPDQQTPTYHVTKPPNWAIWDDRGVCVCTRLVLIPSKTRLQSTMKQVYLSVRLPLRSSPVSAWPRKIALRPGPNGVGRASEAFPAGSWDQNTGILVPCSSDGSCILRGRRVAVVHLHLEEFVVCLCFFWSSDEGHWLFLPGHALAAAFDKSVKFIDGIRSLRMTEALDKRASTEGYHRRLLLRGDVVSIEAAWEVHRGAPFHGAPSPGAPYELFVKLTPLRDIDTRDRKRWARDPGHYAPYNLETGTLHFDHELRNEFAAKEWAELLPNRDSETEVWPFVKDFRSLESSKELIALYFDPLWCYKHRLVPIGDGHGRSMRGTGGSSSPPPRAAGDTTSGETDRGSLVEDGDDDQKSKRRVPDGRAEKCIRLRRRRSM